MGIVAVREDVAWLLRGNGRESAVTAVLLVRRIRHRTGSGAG